MKKFTLFIAGLFLMFGTSVESSGQVTYPYSADFESATTSPASKSYADTSTITLNGLGWKLVGVYIGTMTSSDKYNDAKAARLRLTNNSSGDPGYIVSVEDFTTGVGDFSFYAASYSTEYDTLDVYYSTDGGSTWTFVDDLATTDSLTQHTFTINQSGNVRLKIQKHNSDNLRSNIDDIYVTSYGAASALNIIDKSPLGATLPSTSDLTIKFDNKVATTSTSGSIYVIKPSTSDTQTFDVPSSAISISDSIVTVSGLVLESNTSYYVNMDSGLFSVLDDATIVNNAISDTDYWQFNAIDTSVIVPSIVGGTYTLTTFTDCIGSDLSAFTKYNELGYDEWKCSIYGADDSHAVYINGGSAPGVSENNKDWLITKQRYDLSSLINPVLNFAHKRRFDGDVILKLMVSSDYSGLGDPNEATWVELEKGPFPFSNIEKPDLTWKNTADWYKLTPYAISGKPIFIAFYYECGDTGAYEYSLDNIVIESSLDVQSPQSGHFSMHILGIPNHTQINLFLNSLKGTEMQIEMYDINGRKVIQNKYDVMKGANTIRLNAFNIPSGMYLIRATDESGQTKSVKAVVR